MLKHNANINALLQSGPFCIEWNFGMEAMATYLEQLSFLEAGVKYSELGIGESRAASFPGIITAEAKMVQGSELLRNEAETPEDSFAHLRLQGVMRCQDGASSRGINSMVDDFNAAIANENIVGIVIETNSGGGQALAGQILHSLVSNSSKPVAFHAHLMASAAYMAGMSSIVIASSTAARFGSIGTMYSLQRGMAGLYNKWYQDLYASKSVNKNKSFRQYLEGDLSGIKQELEETNDQFLATVRATRDLKGSSVMQNHTLSGAMFSAEAAMRRGLVDGIGGMDMVINKLNEAVQRRKSQPNE